MEGNFINKLQVKHSCKPNFSKNNNKNHKNQSLMQAWQENIQHKNAVKIANKYYILNLIRTHS